jgi:hypothetical protein
MRGQSEDQPGRLSGAPGPSLERRVRGLEALTASLVDEPLGPTAEEYMRTTALIRDRLEALEAMDRPTGLADRRIRLDDIRARHVKDTRATHLSGNPNPNVGSCRYDQQPWPCDVIYAMASTSGATVEFPLDSAAARDNVAAAFGLVPGGKAAELREQLDSVRGQLREMIKQRDAVNRTLAGQRLALLALISSWADQSNRAASPDHAEEGSAGELVPLASLLASCADQLQEAINHGGQG